MDIFSKVYKDENQKYYLGIHRSDYMLHENRELHQVEINTISSAFASLSTIVQRMHKYVFSFHCILIFLDLLQQDLKNIKNYHLIFHKVMMKYHLHYMKHINYLKRRMELFYLLFNKMKEILQIKNI